MKYKGIIIETGQQDCNGDIIKIDGLKLPETPVVVTRNFDASKPIGMANVYEEGGVIKADIELRTAADGWPAIGVQVLGGGPNERGGRTITAASLYGVSIGSNPNKDPDIKTLGEQAADAPQA